MNTAVEYAVAKMTKLTFAPPASPAMSFHLVEGGALIAESRRADAPTSFIASLKKL